MPVYTVQGPDGRIYKVEGPNAATAEQLGAFLTEQMSDKAVRQAAQRQADIKAVDPTKGMSALDQVRAGGGKAFADTARGIGQKIGLVSFDDVKDSRRLDAPLMGTTGGMAGNVMGNLAIAAPTAAIPGVNTILGGGAVGVGMGLAQPAASFSEMGKNVVTGGIAGAAVPAAVRAAQVGKSLIEPFYQGGREQILGRALNEAAGGQAQPAIQNLRNAQPLVPGSMPTAGQAAGNPGIAALERTAVQTDPVAMNQMAARIEAQNDARIAALQGVTPDRAAAVAAREQAANGLYAQANGRQVNSTPQLAALLQRPSAQNAMARARNIAAETGGQFDPAALTGLDAHRIKMGLDDLVSGAPQAGIGGNELRAIQGTRADFLRELESQIPEYGQARNAYAAGSRPVSQADVLGDVAQRATNFRGNLTPAAMARALRDETAARVTGRPGAAMADVLEPHQMQTLNDIQSDLLRADFANTAGKGVGSDTVQKLAYSNILGKSGLPNWIKDFPGGGLVGRMADIGYKRANDEMRQQLAQALLDPMRTASLMESGLVSPVSQALIESLRRGGAALGTAAPGLIQANQQKALE